MGAYLQKSPKILIPRIHRGDNESIATFAELRSTVICAAQQQSVIAPVYKDPDTTNRGDNGGIVTLAESRSTVNSKVKQ